MASDLEAGSESLLPGPLAHHPASRTIPLPLCLFPSARVPVPPFQLDPEAGAGALGMRGLFILPAPPSTRVCPEISVS